MARGTSRLVTLLPIRNMNRALRFYTKALGARLLARGRGEMRDSWASVRWADSEIWLIRPSAVEKRSLAYTALLVSNIKRTVGQLDRQGVKFQRAERSTPQTKVEGPIAFDSWGAAAFFKDTEGNLLMVWQNMPPM